MAHTRPRLSIVTPAFDEAANLEPLYARLCAALDGPARDGSRDDLAWEWIVVDDHSRDRTFAVVQALAALDARVSGVRLARNAGSHAAFRCGLSLARGDAVVLLVADGQDPPEALPALVSVGGGRAGGVGRARRGRGDAAVVVAPRLPRAAPHSRARATRARRRRLRAAGPRGRDALAGFREQHVNMLALAGWASGKPRCPCAARHAARPVRLDATRRLAVSSTPSSPSASLPSACCRRWAC